MTKTIASVLGMPFQRPDDVTPAPVQLVGPSQPGIDWFRGGQDLRQASPGWTSRYSPCSWAFQEVQSVLAQSLPPRALGTSTAYVGVLEARCIPMSPIPDVWLRTTAIEMVNDLRTTLEGTSFVELAYDNITLNPFRATGTRMRSLRALAPDLSLRQWADAFGVTKQAISNWVSTEPRARPELDEAAAALRAAAMRHPDLSGWLRSPLPGSSRSPLDLVRDRRWKALSAAARLKAPIRTEAGATQSMREDARRRRGISKRLGGADTPPAQDDEE
jgi:hypothetical protein